MLKLAIAKPSITSSCKAGLVVLCAAAGLGPGWGWGAQDLAWHAGRRLSALDSVRARTPGLAPRSVAGSQQP